MLEKVQKDFCVFLDFLQHGGVKREMLKLREAETEQSKENGVENVKHTQRMR